jgi:putative phosphoribosyl transferase
MPDLFQDRTEAGQVLAGRLHYFAGRNDVLVLALPRGGVPVAYEVARELRAPLDVFLVRKLGVPGHEELAMGAIASGGVLVLNEQVLRMLEISENVVREAAEQEARELHRREQIYRGNRPRPEVRGHIVVLIDDGLATGASMRAAVAAIRQEEPAGILIAVPVAPPETVAELEAEVEQFICLETPDPFYAVGIYYRHFPQVTDEEVHDLLEQAAAENTVPATNDRNGINGTPQS